MHVKRKYPILFNKFSADMMIEKISVTVRQYLIH